MITLRRLVLPALFLSLPLFAIDGTGGSSITAQQPFLVEQSRQSPIDFYASNYGIFGLNVAQSRSGFIYPRGSGNSYLFGSGLWFGVKKDAYDDASGNTYRIPLSFITYDPNSGTGWARSGDARYTTDTNYPISRLFNELDYDRTTGISTANASDPRWPLWLKPGRTATALNPGSFEPYDSYRTVDSLEYTGPAFLTDVDEQMTTRYHDAESAIHTPYTQLQNDSLGYPIGVQIQQNIYSWSSGPMASTVVVQYQIVNTSGVSLFECRVAAMGDADIGDAGNDRAGYYTDRPELRSILMSSESEPGKTLYPFVCAVLEAPVTGPDSVADDTRRGVYRNGGRLGSVQIWSIEEEPGTPEARYDFMASGALDESGATRDVRFMAGSATFTLPPLDTAHFAVAYIVLDPAVTGGTRRDDDDHSLASVPNPQLETAVERALAWYYASDPSSGVGRTARSSATLALHPNPATDRVGMQIALAERAHLRLEVIDNIGRTLLSHDLGMRERGVVNEDLDIADLPVGRYTVAVTQGDARTATTLVVTR